MRTRLTLLLGGLAVAIAQMSFAQDARMRLPTTVEAGSAFSIQSAGNGQATLYIVGLGQVLKRDVQLGESASFLAGSLTSAGHYLVVLAGTSTTQNGSFDVVSAHKPANLSFLAKPSRLPVGLHDGITGAVYVFDGYHNLIAAPTSISFELASPSGTLQKRLVITRNGAAWTVMDSTAQQGIDKFVARVDDLYSTRIVAQVPGDPCGLKMTAQQAGQQVRLVTDPVRDCSGNAVPDGTVVTFTENYNGAQSTVDEPLKNGIAEVEMSAHSGAAFSVASGIVMGNQIRWEK
jgi:hypothetical protein